MPSQPPPPEPKVPGSDPAGRRRATKAVRDGTLVFALVLGGFVACAVGTQSTYRASAVVAVEPTSETVGSALPKAKEAVERLERAATDQALVARLAGEEHPVPPDSVEQAATRITSALSIESSDARRFTFSVTARTAERAQRLVNELAQQAASQATRVLDPEHELEPDPGAKAKSELLDFLQAHPSVAAEPAPVAPARSGPDPLVLALRAERARLEAKLAQRQPPSPAENPYDEPSPLEKPEFMKRRLQEIDSALEARANAARSPVPSPSASAPSRLSAEERAEWKRLVQAVSQTKSPEPRSSAPRLRVTLARAPLPQAPIDPDRPRLVLIGVLLSSIAGVLAGLLRAKLEARAYRHYGASTGAFPTAQPMPQTTLRLSREQLPKPERPRTEPLPTPVPEAGPSGLLFTPIPAAPIIPKGITPIPPVPITPVPPPPIAGTPITPVPPPPPAAKARSPIPPAPPAATNAPPATPIPPPQVAAKSLSPLPPGSPASSNETPIPPAPAAPTPEMGAAEPVLTPFTAMIVAGPAPVADGDAPPATLPYKDATPEKPKPEEPEPAPRTRNNARRVTKIYGTPPPPTEFEEGVKALRTTQAYGSPPAEKVSRPPEILPYSPTPIPAEVLPPARPSLRPAPMIPLGSSVPPAVSPATRSGPPLGETSYSYVTPVPESHAIPQTPVPRRPSPPPQTEPYGSIAPLQRRRAPSDPPATSPNPNQPKTPLPPPPVMTPETSVRTHPVRPDWRPDRALDAARKRQLAGEMLTLAVDRCLVVGVTGVRGSDQKKSLAAAELAVALANAKHPRILLMEADFQFPQVHKFMNIDVPLTSGFSHQLRRRLDGGREVRWHVVDCAPSLHVLAEGVMRSPGLLLSNGFEQAVRELRNSYDIIVIDAPVAPNEADGRAISDVVDGAVVVGASTRANEIVEVSRIFSGKKLLRPIES